MYGHVIDQMFSVWLLTIIIINYVWGFAVWTLRTQFIFCFTSRDESIQSEKLSFQVIFVL